MSGGASGWCMNCKQRRSVAKKLCRACWAYQNEHGKQRPRHFWARPRICKNCKSPASEGRHSIIRGRCNACYRYWMAHRVERPERYWKARRWCDCGNPATHFDITLHVMSIDKEAIREERYDLCADCYQLEFDTA